MATTSRKRSSTTKRTDAESGKATAGKAKTRTSKTKATDGKATAQGKKTRSTASGTAKKSASKAGTTGTTRTARPKAAAETTWTEEISVAGNQLVDKFKDLVSEGTVRRVVFKHDGNTLLEVPLAAAIVGGALAVWAAPLVAAVTALAGAATHVTVEVERAGEKPARRAKASKSK
jgi:hypothetical protein